MGSGPAGLVFGENSFYRETWDTRRGGWGGEVVTWINVILTFTAAVRHDRARQISGTGPCGGSSRVQWVAGRRGQYSGKIRFIEKPRIQDEGVGSPRG